MWQIVDGDVVYKPRTFDFVNPATGEIPDEKELFRQKQGMKEIEIRNLKQRLSSQAFAWIKVGTDNPDDPIVDRQVRRGPKGTFKLTYTGDVLDKGPQSGPVEYKQGTPKPPAAIGPGKGSLPLETTAKADITLSDVENTRVDIVPEENQNEYRKRIAREKVEKKEIKKGKPIPKSLSFEEIDRKFKGRTKSGEVKKYTPAKPSTEIEVKKAIDRLDSNIEKLKEMIDKQPVNSRTEETAKSLERVERMKLIKEAEYKDLMSRRSKQRTGTSVRPPSVSKLQKEQAYLENRLSKIDEAIKENVDKYNGIKKYEYGKAAPKQELLKVIKSHVADKKFATEALKVVLLILSRGKAK
ncbi:hypothetical protein UFOVP999_22 [uncultured Caudovirales phage]|uniref:Uncharacterized protein n=1 Tax=uncultured Caudovirales phage TaxID=2100421 RepID=A0A6J5Q727_9CAUD|nr:hypothetical protein UFOVP999_22 [uncultured Caudovirales phage]